MKILFVWRKMNHVAGGVERMVVAMMNEMVRRGHEVALLSWDQANAESYYPMDKRIKWHCLSIGDPEEKGGWHIRIKRMIRLRQIVKYDRPDVILAFESGVFLSVRLFLLGYKIPIVSAERNAPERHDFSDKKYKRYIVFNILRFADKITVQFERYKNGYPAALRHKIVCIHNPVESATIIAKPDIAERGFKKILCVARPSYQKNVDSLIAAFARISQRFTNWRLEIAGEGADLKKLQDMIDEHHLKDKIILLGAVKDIENYYAKSHLFCLPSRYEGFPNALAEAMAHGLPVVGYKGCAGVSDLIEHGKTGLLAEGNGNIDTLAEALASLMGDDALRAVMGTAARKSVDCYQPHLIFDQWEVFFQKVIQEYGQD